MDLDQMIGRRIADLRIKKGMSQQELADAVYSSQGLIAKVETGARKIQVDLLYKIATVLDTDCDYLIRGVAKENTTIADDLGLPNKTIETLKSWQKAIVQDGQSSPSDINRNALFALNLLVQSVEGQLILDDLFKYATTDFNCGAIAREHKFNDDSGSIYFYRSADVKMLMFDSAISGPDNPVFVPVEFLKESILRNLEIHVENLRDSVIKQFGVSREERTRGKIPFGYVKKDETEGLTDGK